MNPTTPRLRAPRSRYDRMHTVLHSMLYFYLISLMIRIHANLPRGAQGPGHVDMSGHPSA